MQETELRQEWLLALLKWARKKTRTVEAAEDLAQETALQWLQTVRREEQAGREVAEPEHLLWRIARYVWCKSLRRAAVYRCEMLPETLSGGQTPEERTAERDEMARQRLFVRRQVMRLSRIQREVMILYYLERLPTPAIAQRLSLSESTVRWHLSDSRKKIREAKTMMNEQEFVYRPQPMTLGVNGLIHDIGQLKQVEGDLLRQNILQQCYREGKGAQELCDALGVARLYVENALAYLLKEEMLREKGGRYETTFLMTTQAEREARLALYVKYRDSISRPLVRRLQEKEAAIRAIGFVGADRPMDKLLWWLIYHVQFVTPVAVPCPERPIHRDGGRYHLMGFIHEKPPVLGGWDYNGSMYSEGFYWFGLYNFGSSRIGQLFDGGDMHDQPLGELLMRLIANGFALSCVAEKEKEKLAELVQLGFVSMEGEKMIPNFCALTSAQYARLQDEIFRPIVREIQPAYDRLTEEMRTLCQNATPPQLQAIADLPLHMALLDLHYMTEQIAFEDGCLYRPATPEEGALLTLVYAPFEEEVIGRY